MLIDHNIFNKFFYIYNAINLDNYPIRDNVQENNIICFVGSITPAKGFHVLAKQWPKIKKKIPDAKLYVIGSGNLYDRNQRLGKFSIAESTYEKTFINYLTDRNGAISSDVKFFGVLDNNLKIEVMNKAKVGVVNPTARGETFCISAIEFEALDIPVVSRKKWTFKRISIKGRNILIGDNVILEGGVKINSKGYKIRIGDNTFINSDVLIRPNTFIGQNVSVGQQVLFLSDTHIIGTGQRRAGESIFPKISIGDGCWIGARVTVLGGVTIGEGTVISAGSVVNKNCKSNSLYAGVPPKFIKKI
ncbi:glycosyltransferase [Lactococcus laudensis]|uniref:glycosyltransferase n=1 Tax=Pseudolactococcus laudensis TaxID=1494461 RepID=UPI002FC79FF9